MKASDRAERGRAREARATLPRMRRVVPSLSSVLLLLASAAFAATDPSAPGTSQQALRHYAQGRLAEERGENDTALSEYYRALLLEPRAADVARRVSELSARTGDTERSLEFAERSLALEPQNPRGLWLKGAALFNLGRVPDALPLLLQAAQRDSENAEFLRTLGRVAEHLDRVDLVAWANEKVIEVEDDDGESWFQLATAKARLGDYAAAQDALDHAVELNPLRPGILFMQGWVKELMGDDRAAIDLYRNHLAIHDGDQLTRRRLVNLLARQKRFAEADREAQALVAASPRDVDVLAVEADLAFEVGQPARALKALRQMEDLAGDDPAVIERVLVALVRHDRAPAAGEAADRWREAHPKDCRATMLQARARALAGNSTEAMTIAARAAQQCPDSLAPRILVARLHQDAKQFAEAEKDWRGIVSAHPEQVGAWLDLAFCREQLGDLAGAQQAARDVLAREPDNPTVLNFLGYLLADHNRDLDEAANLIGRAVRQDPDNGAFVDSMGWLYYRQGRLVDARRELEKAALLTHGDPVVLEHLGDVYKDLRLLDLARDQYRKSLARDGSNQRVRHKLAEIR